MPLLVAYLFSPERLIDRRTLLGKHARSIFGNVHTIFQSHAELAVNRDRRFIAETHARLDPRLISAHQIRPFMPIQTDAMSSAVGQAGKFVARTESEIRHHFPPPCI